MKIIPYHSLTAQSGTLRKAQHRKHAFYDAVLSIVWEGENVVNRFLAARKAYMIALETVEAD
jgi:hypothetical protein